MRQNVLHRLSWHVLCLLLLLLSAGCGGCGGGAGTGKVLIKLNWYPEAEHGGYYAAVVKHLYQDQGLDVEILRGGDQVDVPGLVASGQAAFGVANADDVLLARAQGRPVVAVMAPLQKGPQCIMVHKESGITRFDQLHGLTLAVERQAPYFKYLERKVDLTGVKVVPYSGGVSRFLEDPKYAQQGYVFSEPILVRKAKGSAERNAGTRCLMLYEVGYNPYTSALFTTESLIKDNPELVRKMVTASVRGWELYVAQPEETNAYLLKVNGVIDSFTLAEGAKALMPLVRDEVAKEKGVGHMSAARWEELRARMEEAGVINPGAVRANEAFDARFLPKPD